jgi:hypothetical protein
MHQDEAIQLFTHISRQINSQWDAFITDVKSKTSKDDPSVIQLKDFLGVLAKYKV